jgi:hypothetical protein
MLPDSNAYFMFKHLKKAPLILYPDSGHGVLFQYPQSSWIMRRFPWMSRRYDSLAQCLPG